ncbi:MULTISPECIES: isocitrate lyase/PEP mutase family protein [Thalassobaculum]|uniref:2-methylisocitrate lyase n=1 Tax=Thalassobaculum litoreum DSM 18839 TaxID=1123362 RepID=A0A8G2BMB3_9PROT|nr:MULTISPECIES: isocitrate lyase/phosphoenolpyruvate mutase family protein [Thalassobaculum]SDG35048.1 Phosphoenolpyruvate phosphomutase [Thalassobaculum litoreum DSM 18839]
MTTLADRRKKFRAMLEERRAVLVPGAANALTARVIEDQGFEACYVTGAGIANTLLGVPDIGLVTMSEIQTTTAAIAEISSLPLFVDMDTGFGNAINTHRTVRVLERAGACAVQIEDQVFPKKCGHFDGKAVIPAKEMATKVRAAADAREDENFLIIARTDARAIEGIDAALDRARMYIEAGADVTFVEAPISVEEMQRICAELPVPQVANLVVGGRTPMLSQEELATIGFAIVLYANTPLQAAMRAMSEVLGALKRDGNLDAVQDRLADFVERQRLVHKSTYDAMEKTYAVEE